jgi:hypothetical protein
MHYLNDIGQYRFSTFLKSKSMSRETSCGNLLHCRPIVSFFKRLFCWSADQFVCLRNSINFFSFLTIVCDTHSAVWQCELADQSLFFRIVSSRYIIIDKHCASKWDATPIVRSLIFNSSGNKRAENKYFMWCLVLSRFAIISGTMANNLFKSMSTDRAHLTAPSCRVSPFSLTVERIDQRITKTLASTSPPLAPMFHSISGFTQDWTYSVVHQSVDSIELVEL